MNLPLILRRAVRSLLRYPGVSVLAVTAIALGVGLPTATFSIVDAAILRGLPVANADRLMHLERRKIGQSGEGAGAAARDFVVWREQQKSFEKLGAYRVATVSLRVGPSVDRWEAAYVTSDILPILGTRPTSGRVFNADDAKPGTQSPVLLADHVWRDRFNRDKNVMGTTVLVNGAAHTVIGVMPSNFRFPVEADLWLPMEIPAAAVNDESFPTIEGLGLLKENVSRSAARAEFAVIAQRLAQTYPETNRNLEVTIKPYTERYMGEVATTTMYVMMIAVLLVLVIACSNVANLLLVRAIHRSRDVAVSMALGASRHHIVAQVLVESALMSLIGGALGLVIANVAIKLLARMFVGRLPYWADPRLDTSVLLFAIALAVAAALLAGIVPALKTTASDLSKTLRDDSRGATGVRANRVMQTMIVVELAVSMGLLVATGLLGISVRNSSHVNFGFETASLFTARVSLADSASSATRNQFYDALEQRLQDEPGVRSVGLVSDFPGTHASFRRISMDGILYRTTDEIPAARYAAASSKFFSSIKVQAIQGRLINSQDLANSEPVALVNARFVERFSPKAEIIGKRIRIGTAADGQWRTVVGVVPNLWMGAFDAQGDKNPAGVYIPLSQSHVQSVSIAVNTQSSTPLAMTDAVRNAVFSVNREAPIYQINDIPQLVESGTWFYGMGAGILGVCGASALVLAFVGIYGVIAFSVGRRRREFGIRMALGANSVGIIRLVLGRGMLHLAIGLGIGLLLAVVLSNGVASLLFGVSPSDPVVFGAVAIALAAIATFAMFIPALSAARTQPLDALRSE